MRLRLLRLLICACTCAVICIGGFFVHTSQPFDTVDDPKAFAVTNFVAHVLAAAVGDADQPLSSAGSARTMSPDSTPTLSPEPTPEIRHPTTRVSEASAANRIPYILHQTWINNMIPSTYVPYVESWLKHQPPLSYYYWTDAKSVEFVAKHYPHMLAMFKGYKVHLNRADAIRYMLLHHYGGVYADMDIQRLKDLAPLLNTSRELCYLSQERYEITRLYWGLNSSVMNAVMLSSPGHRFMEYVVNALPRYAHHSPNVMESTGPFFLQNAYDEFMRSPPCNLSEATCRCAVADPYLFMPQIDPIRIPQFRGKCSGRAGLASNAREACEMLDKIGWQNEVSVIGRNSYTHHGFLHYGFENQRLHFASEAEIGNVRKDKLTFGTDFV